MLGILFKTKDMANLYQDEIISSGSQYYDEFIAEIDHELEHLKSIEDRLELYEEQLGGSQSGESRNTLQQIDPKRVFVVHGHDNEAKQTVARFLEKLGLKPIILREQVDLGQTIIEKFEANANVGFAVVLITPDDVGASNADHSSKGQASLRARARQNVIFELGFFMGKLGRLKVRALVKGDIDILSDIQGVIFNPIDPHDAWQFRLARELKESGMDIDLAKAF
jgi:predicted nucleotide-binding protein